MGDAVERPAHRTDRFEPVFSHFFGRFETSARIATIARSKRSVCGGTFAPVHRNELGRCGEDLAARFLQTRGWRIVDRNVRYREGEIDIIGLRGGVLAFVEVKTRRSRAFGSPSEAVTFTKQRRIRRLASRYLAERRPGVAEVRFDIVEVARDGAGFLITHLEDAF